MQKIKIILMIFTALILSNTALAKIPAPKSKGISTRCEKELERPTYYQRAYSLEMPEWKNNLSFIRADLEASAWGVIRPFFSKKWDTEVYYTATGAPDRNLQIPLVDPDAKAVVLFIHGNGTVKSSGANFVVNMAALARTGVSALSIDLPFHAGGPLADRYKNIDAYMKWLKMIVDDVASYGKPVYLAGHSFGPEVIFEFISRYPEMVTGALALSPACFDPVTEAWYQSHTSHMRFGGTVLGNTLGGEWGAIVSNQRTWNQGVRPDPTVANPKLILDIVSGDREEYVPGPTGGPNKTPIGKNTYDIQPVLQSYFHNAKIHIEPNIGHYLFDFVDQDGKNLVQHWLFNMLGMDINKVDEMINQMGRVRELRSPSQLLTYRFQFDLIFRAWFLENHGEHLVSQIFTEGRDAFAQSLLNQYREARDLRLRQIMNEVIATKETDPKFYELNKARIDAAVARGTVDGSLFGIYFKYVFGTSVAIN